MTTAVTSQPSFESSATDAPRSDWVRWALVLWVVFAGAVTAKALVEPHEHSLYPCYEEPALDWWAGRPMYTHGGYCRYAPTFAIAFSPFALLPDGLGYAAWSVLSVAVTCHAMRVAVRDLLPGNWTPRAEALFLALALLGAVRGLWAGQINSLVLSLGVFAGAAILRGRWWGAAACLALAVFFKVWPLALALLLIACFPRRLGGRFVLCCAALAVVPFLVKPPAVAAWQYGNWFAFLGDGCQVRFPAYRDFWSLFDFHTPTLVSAVPIPAGYQPSQLLTAAAVLAWCLWQRCRWGVSPRALTAVLGAWICWQLLFGPGSERNTYGILALLTGWALVDDLQAGRKPWLSGTACTLQLLFGFTGALERALLPVLPFAAALLPVSALLALAWLVLRCEAWARVGCASAQPDRLRHPPL